MIQSLEDRRLLAIVSVAGLDEMPQTLSADERFAYFTEFHKDLSKYHEDHVLGVKRVDIDGSGLTNIRPKKGSQWNLDDGVTIDKRRNGAWIIVGRELWSVADDSDRASKIFGGDAASRITDREASADRSRLYFTVEGARTQQLLVSDGSASGTKVLFEKPLTAGDIAIRQASDGIFVVAGEKRSDQSVKGFFIGADKPDRLVDVSKPFAAFDERTSALSAAPLDDGRTLVWSSSHLYLADRGFRKVNEVASLGTLGPGRRISDAAPIDGGFAFSLSVASSPELWVADASAKNARRVASIDDSTTEGWPVYSTHLMRDGGLFAITNTLSNDTTGSDSPLGHVAEGSTLRGESLYQLSFTNGLTRISHAAGDRSIRLSDGHLVVAGGVHGTDLIDLGDIAHPVLYTQIFSQNAVAAGDKLLFTEGFTGRYLLALDPSRSTGMVTGKVEPHFKQGDLAATDIASVPRPRVYADLNGDGMRESNEPSTLTTDQHSYILTGIPARKRIAVRVDADPRLYSNVAQASSSVKLQPNAQTGRDLELIWQPAQVSVFVYDDRDQDGVHDADEPGIKSVRVSANSNSVSARTKSNGRVVFSDLKLDPYKFSMKETSTYFGTGRKTITVTPRPGTITRVEFPVRYEPKTASLTIKPFRDRNRDGVRRAGEPTLAAGTQIRLMQVTTKIADATVDAAGGATFTHLSRGTYSVQLLGAPTTADGSPTMLMTDQTYTLAAAEQRFEYVPVRIASQFSGVAYADQNRNGVRDAGESVLPGASVYLVMERDHPQTGNVFGMRDGAIRTDGQGRFSLSYWHNDPTATIQAVTTTGSYRIYSSTVQLPPGRDVTMDIGFTPQVATGTIVVSSYIDRDFSATRNGTEAIGPIPDYAAGRIYANVVPASGGGAGVTEALLGSDGTLFTSLLPGQYRLTFGSHSLTDPVTDIDDDGVLMTVTAGAVTEIAFGVRP